MWAGGISAAPTPRLGAPLPPSLPRKSLASRPLSRSLRSHRALAVPSESGALQWQDQAILNEALAFTQKTGTAAHEKATNDLWAIVDGDLAALKKQENLAMLHANGPSPPAPTTMPSQAMYRRIPGGGWQRQDEHRRWEVGERRWHAPRWPLRPQPSCDPPPRPLPRGACLCVSAVLQPPVGCTHSEGLPPVVHSPGPRDSRCDLARS
jgi:hypothetical protein